MVLPIYSVCVLSMCRSVSPSDRIWRLGVSACACIQSGHTYTLPLVIYIYSLERYRDAMNLLIELKRVAFFICVGLRRSPILIWTWQTPLINMRVCGAAKKKWHVQQRGWITHTVAKTDFCNESRTYYPCKSNGFIYCSWV